MRQFVTIHPEEIDEKVFCFGGEFGYGPLSWLPYLNHVAHELGIPLRTASRPGSTPLYGYSAEHFEVPFDWRPDMFGSEDSDRFFESEFGTAAVIARNPKRSDAFALSVGGIKWEHRRIHERLTTKNHRPLHFEADAAAFLPESKPIAIINNKDFDNWGNTDPLLRESFTPTELVEMRNVLTEHGYFVVYHRFDEQVMESRFPLEDSGLFEGEDCLDMRAIYADAVTESDRTRRQLELYRSSDLAVCPQGGNSFLPIIFGLDTLVLMKSPRIVEYQDLARLYEARVDVHTSTALLVAALQYDATLRKAIP